jgi:hypothetical protein
MSGLSNSAPDLRKMRQRRQVEPRPAAPAGPVIALTPEEVLGWQTTQNLEALSAALSNASRMIEERIRPLPAVPAAQVGCVGDDEKKEEWSSDDEDESKHESMQELNRNDVTLRRTRVAEAFLTAAIDSTSAVTSITNIAKDKMGISNPNEIFHFEVDSDLFFVCKVVIFGECIAKSKDKKKAVAKAEVALKVIKKIRRTLLEGDDAFLKRWIH